MSVVIETLVS